MSNHHVRCRVHLADPSLGMSGGGEGECRHTTGETSHARFASG